MTTSLVWFRQDLRLADNPALVRAAQRGAVVPVFLWQQDEEAPWQPGGARRWWLHDSLAALQASLAKVGSRLIVRRGPTLATLRDLLTETGADAVFWNRRYEPAIIERDTRIKQELVASGAQAESSNAGLLYEPWTIRTKQDRPYQVFTPFFKMTQTLAAPPTPLAVPRLESPPTWPHSEPLDALRLLPRIDWAGGMRAEWTPGEDGAASRLSAFLEQAVQRYHEARDRPDLEGVSRLSPHLHHGEISPRQIYHALADALNLDPTKWPQGFEVFLKEIVWREFAYHLLYHFPHTATQPLRADFERFPWVENPEALRSWQRGQTGYPLVDAGMRQLWASGWMHNRVRMVVASFLVKHLLISWQSGAAWFWDTLVDADLASNTLGWQWSAGCGADAAPYFRIFNPIAQGEKFDPRGNYVRAWVPELARVPNELIHRPWEASAGQRANWGMAYPEPMVEHAAARERALAALATISNNA